MGRRRKVGKERCRWCGILVTWHQPRGQARLPTDRTRDHVAPLSMGGSDKPANIVLACHGCNNQRGQLSDHFFVRPNWLRTQVARAVADGLGPAARRFRTLEKHLKGWHRRNAVMTALLERWVEVERCVLGWSPLARLRDLEPPPQRVRTLRRIEEKAHHARRHVAEAAAQAATEAAWPPACERDATPAAC